MGSLPGSRDGHSVRHHPRDGADRSFSTASAQDGADEFHRPGRSEWVEPPPTRRRATMARTVTAHLFHAVNGVVESPDQWQFDAFGEVEMAALGDAIADVTDTVI